MDGIEIRYAGVLLGRATQTRDQSPAGLFVGFSEPLPIGTPVSLKSADGDRVGKVTEVVESADPAVAGMRVQYRTEASAEAPHAAPEAVVAGAVPSAVPSTISAAVSAAAHEQVAEAHPSGPENASGPHDGEHGRKKRRRR